MADKTVRKKRSIKMGGIDISFLTIIVIMICFGLIMVFSASAPSAFYRQGDQFYYIKRQLLWTVCGFVAMFVVSNINYKLVKKWATVFAVVSFVLIVLVRFVGSAGGGAQRWLAIGPIRFQPSEIAKFALIFYFAKRISEKPRGHMEDFKTGLLPYLLILGAFCGVFILQDHLSAAVVTFLALVIVIYIGGAKISHFIGVGIAGAALLAPFAYFERYRLERLIAFIDPFKYISDEGWQIVQGLYAIGSGGIFGRGLGQSRQKFLYVPEAHNDYIYAILCEELGLIGAMLVAILFIALITRGITIAMHAPDTFSSLAVYGIISLVGLQYLINVGVVTAWLPNTGMQLPFFSAGGTSLIFIMAAMGFVLNVSRYMKETPNKLTK